jgi:TRAP-type mannitol/chloroaromatic compound transport system substrate-binding protein
MIATMQRVLLIGLTAVACGPSSVSVSAQEPPAVTLDLASTFPGSMPILGDAAQDLAERVNGGTGGEV